MHPIDISTHRQSVSGSDASEKVNSVTVVTTKPSCNGGNNGSACATDISGGNGPFTYSWNTIPVQTTACATGLSKGFYVLTVTSADGCNFFSNVQIKQPANLEVAIATGAHNVNALASGGTKPYTYLWSNGKTIKKIYGLANGTYTVTVTDFNGCTKTATAIITGTAKMGETGIDISTDLNVYPNPADQEVSISFVSHGDETYTLNIIDYMGKSVFNKNAKTVTGENITEFNFGSYPAGIYIINIITQESGPLSKPRKALVISRRFGCSLKRFPSAWMRFAAHAGCKASVRAI